jgi:tetratricopeptide (TPR) repeat protein
MSNKVLFSVFLVISILVAGCMGRPENKFFDEAIHYRNEGELDKSIESLKKAIAAAPKTDKGREALYMLGDVYYQSGDFKRALKVFNKYLDITDVNDKKKFQLLNKIAFINYSKLNEYKPALFYYFKALNYASSRTDKFDVYANMGNCYFKLYKFDKAVEYFDKGVKELGDHVDSDMAPRVQETLYYMAFSYFVLTQDFTEHYYQQKGFNPSEKMDANEPLKKVLEILDKCISYSAQSKYGVLCKYQKAETFEEMDNKQMAIATLKELRGVYPNEAVIESKINKLLGKE